MSHPVILRPQLDKAGHPHISVNVVAPNAAAKRIAFGVVANKGQVMTDYALTCIRDHVADVTRLYQLKQWNV